MKGARSVKAVELVRKIRDGMARRLADKTEAEVIAFFRQAGERARRRAERYAMPRGRARRAG
jgi:hypothetical protein